MIRLLDCTLPGPEQNLALDQALQLEMEESSAAGLDPQGHETLRFWESPVYCVVLGAFGRLIEDVNVEACLRDRIPILRRYTGGGTVLLGPGCLNFTLVLSLRARPELCDVAWSYREILGLIAIACRCEGACQAGLSDLALERRKFSGNAQRRKRHSLLHHGTLLYGFELGMMARYLREPRRQPAYREGRPHAVFARNLPARPDDLKRRIGAAWNAVPWATPSPSVE